MSKLSYEQVIQRDGKYVASPVGTSMMPLLRQNSDTVLLEKPNGRLNKYDVALYKRKSGEYVLHRVMKVTECGYVFCGDNQSKYEYGICDENVIGVMTGFWRGKRFVRCDSFGYRLYTHVWCFSHLTRKLFLFVVRAFNAVKRRIVK